MLESLFNKVAGFTDVFLLANIAKVLRTAILKNMCKRLLLQSCKLKSFRGDYFGNWEFSK